MKRGWILIGVLMLLQTFAGAQTGWRRQDGIALKTRGGMLYSIPNAKIRVCQSGAAGTPCTPLATIYTDRTLTTAIDQASTPVYADAAGNFAWFAPLGCYYEQITDPATNQVYSQNDVCLGGPQGPQGVATVVTSNGANGDWDVQGELLAAEVKARSCSPIRGAIAAADCNLVGNGTTDDTTSANGFLAAGSSTTGRLIAAAATYRLCGAAIASGNVSLDLGYLTRGGGNGTTLKATDACATNVFNVAANLGEVHLRGFVMDGNNVAPKGLQIARPVNGTVRDVQFTNFPTGASQIYQGGGLYSIFERNIFSSSSRDLYSFNIQKANATGSHFYSCNFCLWRDNEIYAPAIIGGGQGNLFEHNDVELTVNVPTVIDGTDSGMATGYQSSYNHNYFELTAGTGTNVSVIKPQALALEVNGNEMQGPQLGNPAVSTTMGTDVTVGAGPTSVTFYPPDCTNIDTNHWYIADAGSTAKRELVKPTAVTASPCAVTATINYDHASTATFTNSTINPGSTCIDLTNSTTDGAASIVTGNRIQGCEVGIRADWIGAGGDYTRLWIGNYFTTHTTAIAQTLPPLTFAQDRWKPYGGALVGDRLGLFLYGMGLHWSECTVVDTVLNLAQCNNFSMALRSGQTLTGVQHAKPGIFVVHFPTAGVIVSNAGFNLCAAANYTVHANEVLFFEVKNSTTPVVYEIGQQSCIGKLSDGTLTKVVSGKPAAAVAGTDYGAAYNARYCGTTATCSNTTATALKMIFGEIKLSSGAATVTGISPAFTSTTSFECSLTDKTSAAAAKITNTSSSSITINGTGTDVVAYVCVGY